LFSASTVRVLPLPPLLTLWLILDFFAVWSQIDAPDIFGQHDLTSNLDEFRYPRRSPISYSNLVLQFRIVSNIQFWTFSILIVDSNSQRVVFMCGPRLLKIIENLGPMKSKLLNLGQSWGRPGIKFSTAL